jgi:NADH dehydrogenase FAD-containing subunit
MSKIVLIGGGHVNCQVLKMLKTLAPVGSKLTMVCESDKSYYSGMLPGSTANIYKPEDIQVELKPLAAW